jgi:general stress protein CsbA
LAVASLRSFFTLEVCFEVFLWKKARSPWLVDVDHRCLRAGFCLMNRNENRKEGGDDLLVVLI